MRKLMLLVGFVVGFAAINARIEATRDCGCQPDGWCKQPGLRHFRWLVPYGHKGVPPEEKLRIGFEGTGETR